MSLRIDPSVLNLRPSDPAKVARRVRSASPPVMAEEAIEDFSLWPAKVKGKNQGSIGACFPAGTRVRMEDGSERRIEDVRLLDRVLTAEGNIGRVVRTMVRDADKGLVRLSLWGHSHLTATEEHPILTRRGYIPIADLKLDDWVCLPKYAPQSRAMIHVADYMTARYLVNRPGKGRRNFGAPQGRKVAVARLTPIPDVIHMSSAVGRIMGFFLAEGRSDKCKVTFTFSKQEEHTLVAELVQHLKVAWDVEAHLQFRPNNSINVVVYGTQWARLFEALCSNGSGGKTIHGDILSGPAEFLRAMLTAWLDGDGHHRRNGTQGVTISRNLALGMYDIAQALGLRPSIRRYEMKTYGAVKTRQPRWEIDIPDEAKDTYRCEGDDRCVWRKVKGIEREEFEGPVFNLEVEGDNSYVAEGVGVHNCNGHAAATALEFARAMQGLEYTPLSAWWIYGTLVKGRDVGSNIMDALALCEDRGVATESDVRWGDYSGRYPATASASAARHRVLIGDDVSGDWRAILTAVGRRRPVNLAIHADARWLVNNGSLDAEGVAPVGRGPANHAVMVGGAIRTLGNGERAVLCTNSWGPGWGFEGRCWLTRAHIDAAAWTEAYTIAAAASDPMDLAGIAVA